MKVLVFAPYAGWSPHWETDLELMEKHLSAGDEVVLIGCGRDYERCDINPRQDSLDCLNCIGRRRDGVGQLSGRVSMTTIGKMATAEDLRQCAAITEEIHSLEQARTLTLDNFDLGMGALSSLFSMCRDSNPDFEEYQTQLKQFVRSAALTYLVMQRHLAAEPPDQVYLFNGRHAILRAVVRACQRHQIPFLVHDRGSTLEHYTLTEGSMVQELSALARRVETSWQQSRHTIEEREQIAHRWFETRAQGVIANWYSYTEQQLSGRLPAEWDPRSRNVAIFTSSDDELAAMGEEWRNPLFADQHKGLMQVLEKIRPVSGGMHFFVRMHPNLAGVKNERTRRLLDLRLPHVTVLPPESPVCSYALMKSSEKVLTFGSTIGIETTYWERPSVLAGPSVYRHLGATHNPANLQHLVEMLVNRNLPACDRTGAIKYAYDLATYGHRFEYFRPDGICSGYFKGKRVESRGVDRIKIKMVNSTRKRLRRLASIFRRAG